VNRGFKLYENLPESRCGSGRARSKGGDAGAHGAHGRPRGDLSRDDELDLCVEALRQARTSGDVREIKELSRFEIETATPFACKPCVSPVWEDTCIARVSLDRAGLPADQYGAGEGAEWMRLPKKVLGHGDWANQD